MSEPNKQLQHWHNVKETAKEKLKEIHQGKEKAADLPKWKQLLKQAKICFDKVRKA